MQKFYALVEDGAFQKMKGNRDDELSGEMNPHIHTMSASQLPKPNDSLWLVCIEPYNYHARFTLAKEDGVTILPGHHDPGKIGQEVAKHFGHVKATSDHTMRDLALLLHKFHGAAFHPDT